MKTITLSRVLCVGMILAFSTGAAYFRSDGGGQECFECGCDCDCESDGVQNARFPSLNSSQRFTSTATDGSGIPPGAGITVTWSIAPDGSPVSGQQSNVIQVLDDMFNDPNAGSSDLTNRLWHPLIQQGLEAWSPASGITYVYEPNDDGAAYSSANRGILGVRGDTRIFGFDRRNAGVVGDATFPPFSDIRMNTTSVSVIFFPDNPTPARLNSFINFWTHEAGHALGMRHVNTTEQFEFIMEPGLQGQLNGPQLDDIIRTQYRYGDAFETSSGVDNDSIQNATDVVLVSEDEIVSIGSTGDAGTVVDRDVSDFVSIDALDDFDFFRSTLPGSFVSCMLRPVGQPYNAGSTASTRSLTFKPSIQRDLALAAFSGNNQQLADSDGSGLGGSEFIYNVPNALDTFFRVSADDGATNTVQLYEIRMVVTSHPIGDVDCDGVVNMLDIAPFIAVLQSGVYSLKADVNLDGVVNFSDIAPFITLL